MGADVNCQKYLMDSDVLLEMAAPPFFFHSRSVMGTNGKSFTFSDRCVRHEGQAAAGERCVSRVTDSLISFSI